MAKRFCLPVATALTASSGLVRIPASFSDTHRRGGEPGRGFSTGFGTCRQPVWCYAGGGSRRASSSLVVALSAVAEAVGPSATRLAIRAATSPGVNRMGGSSRRQSNR